MIVIFLLILPVLLTELEEPKTTEIDELSKQLASLREEFRLKQREIMNKLEDLLVSTEGDQYSAELELVRLKALTKQSTIYYVLKSALWVLTMMVLSIAVYWLLDNFSLLRSFVLMGFLYYTLRDYYAEEMWKLYLLMALSLQLVWVALFTLGVFIFLYLRSLIKGKRHVNHHQPPQQQQPQDNQQGYRETTEDKTD